MEVCYSLLSRTESSWQDMPNTSNSEFKLSPVTCAIVLNSSEEILYVRFYFQCLITSALPSIHSNTNDQILTATRLLNIDVSYSFYMRGEYIFEKSHRHQSFRFTAKKLPSNWRPELRQSHKHTQSEVSKNLYCPLVVRPSTYL